MGNRLTEAQRRKVDAVRLIIEKHRDVLRETCEGFDDPEDRCPHHPSECVCYPVRAALAQEGGGDGK